MATAAVLYQMNLMASEADCVRQAPCYPTNGARGCSLYICMYVRTYLPTFHSFSILVSSFVGVGSCSTLRLSGMAGGEGGE